ncbi:MAG: primosomal protein N' [Chromatiales bacterium]|nr:MAG: primosomal protein N' [Chromatiales bacterium]
MRDSGPLPHAIHRDIHRNCGKLSAARHGGCPPPVNSPTVLRVALATPLKRLFDYLPPQAVAEHTLTPGCRVRVPFGRGKRIGLIADVSDHTDVPAERLRRATAVLDTEPLLDPYLLALLRWAADYYQYPLGEVVATALPAALRRGQDLATPSLRWCCTPEGRQADPEKLGRRAPVQARILDAARRMPDGIGPEDLDPPAPNWRNAVKSLQEKGLLSAREGSILTQDADARAAKAGPQLNPAQCEAAQAIEADAGYRCYLLEGVTGSGKTEVYLHAIAAQLAAGRQSLVLVPEIGLTPQLVQRFRERLGVPVAVLHSGLADGERLRSWTAAARGEAGVVIGTRSAVFTPLCKPGLFIVDEEHDTSLKQQDGFRYSARDLLVWRARQLNVSVILGSATPALESLENAHSGRYMHLHLPERPGAAEPPTVKLVDLRRYPAPDGLSQPLLAAVRRHLDADGQVLIYLNRRGYAPVLLCGGCGYVAECRRCDARMVLHRHRSKLVCHHCGAERPAPSHCPECAHAMHPVGQGTERLQHALQEQFPDEALLRIDRDTTRRRGELAAQLERFRRGEARLLLGTQMLTKGHDFPALTLVGVIDADQGLFGTDFRASERLAQSFVQVAGRAGRADRAGEVLIQTASPEHPLLTTLVRDGYTAFAERALAERREAGWPPFGFLALLRAEAARREAAFEFLDAALTAAGPYLVSGVTLLGPAPAPMERRQGRFRAQLLVQARQRPALQAFLQPWRLALEDLPTGRRARWSLDVDPVELY